MTSYLQTREISSSLKALVASYVKSCLEQKSIPEDFSELIKHNFYAKYATYNSDKKTIEIGVNESKTRTSYPTIQVYTFPIERTDQWLDDSFKKTQGDLEFYARLLNKNANTELSSLVLI